MSGVAVVAVTPLVDGRTRAVHLLTDTDAAAGRAQGGRYVAVCGAVVVAASLSTPEGEACRWCAVWARQRRTP
ncbi:MAG: hypothetical protein ACRDSP_26415 [Pseudonocardiaceae bacterium]